MSVQLALVRLAGSEPSVYVGGPGNSAAQESELRDLQMQSVGHGASFDAKGTRHIRE